MSVRDWILDYPPRIDQRSLGYSEAEARFTCWIAAALMAIRWKDRQEAVRLPATLPDPADRMAQTLFREQQLTDWGFLPHSGGEHVWTREYLATFLRAKGPMVCCGRFAEGDNRKSDYEPGPQHAITVHGYAHNFGGVYYVDPWGAKHLLMRLDRFQQQLLRSPKAVWVRVANFQPEAFKPGPG